jgi:phytol kinase
MLQIIIVILVVLILLLIAEYLWKVKHYHSELTRKFIHITVGSFVAFWPYFLDWNQIYLLALGFLVVIIVSRSASIFRSIHSINRRTIGDFLFALVIPIVALITHDRLIFTIAMLHLSLADGVAAVVGTRFGKKNRYQIFGQYKSIIGTIAFWLCSLALITAFMLISHVNWVNSKIWLKIIWLPILATAMENVGVYGTDNIIVPVLIALVLST